MKMLLLLIALLLASPNSHAIVELDASNKTELQDAFAAAYARPDTVLDENGNEIANPESKADFMKRMVKQHIQRVYHDYKRSSAVRTTEETVKTDVESKRLFK